LTVGLEQMTDLCNYSKAETNARQQVDTAKGEAVTSITNNISMDVIESEMLSLPQVECPVTHHFGPGVYIREAFLPAGTYVMGHAHKCEHMNMMIKGKMAVIVNGEAKVIEGPYIFTGQPGRKLAYILEDTVFQNIYGTDETDPSVIEDMYVDKSAAWVASELEKQCIDLAVMEHLERIAA
jgi:hypothetical protein